MSAQAMLEFPGLPAPHGGRTPAERRRALLALGTRELADLVVELALALRPAATERLDWLARAVALPAGEVAASPFGSRAAAMAAADGIRTAHHELRQLLDWPEAVGAGPEVADEAHGYWEAGVLHVGKYQAFLQDDAWATFNPNHSAKWAPHELLHRVVGAFYRPGQSRWELYLAARLDELVPVVHWYGPDQVLRLGEASFDRAHMTRNPAAPLEQAHWLTESAGALRDRARQTAPHLQEGVRHFERELAAIDEEIATGRRVRVVHAFLDSSSDATAYVVGHFARLSCPTVSQVLAAAPGISRDIHDMRARAEATFDRLLFGSIRVEPERASWLSEQRTLRDWLSRLAHLGPDAAEVLAPLMPDAIRDLSSAASGGPIPLDDWRRRLEDELGPRLSSMVLRSGMEPQGTEDPQALAVDQLRDGIDSIAPATWRWLEQSGHGNDLLWSLARSPELCTRAPLSARLRIFLERAHPDPVALDLLGFEQLLAGLNERDDAIERLSSPPGDDSSEDRALVVASRAFRIVELARDVVPLHAALLEEDDDVLPAEAPPPGSARYLVGRHFDNLAVAPAPASIQKLWASLTEAPQPLVEILQQLGANVATEPRPPEWPQDARGWITELRNAGAVGIFPGIRGERDRG